MEIVFRAITKSDLEMLLNWRTNPDVSSYMYTDVAHDMDKQREWYATISRDKKRMDWIITVDEEDVGLLTLNNIDATHRRCEWAYYLGSPSVRGKGIGKNVELNILAYVFETLDLNKLCCEVFVSNATVIGIHEKYGSIVEGTRRQQICKNGVFHDIVEMGILREDWELNIKGRIEYTKARFADLDKGIIHAQKCV